MVFHFQQLNSSILIELEEQKSEPPPEKTESLKTESVMPEPSKVETSVEELVVEEAPVEEPVQSEPPTPEPSEMEEEPEEEEPEPPVPIPVPIVVPVTPVKENTYSLYDANCRDTLGQPTYPMKNRFFDNLKI